MRIRLVQRGVKADSEDQRGQNEAEQGDRPTHLVQRTPGVSVPRLESRVQLEPKKETEEIDYLFKEMVKSSSPLEFDDT